MDHTTARGGRRARTVAASNSRAFVFLAAALLALLASLLIPHANAASVVAEAKKTNNATVAAADDDPLENRDADAFFPTGAAQGSIDMATSCIASQRSTGLGWTCDHTAANDRMPDGTKCSLQVCPPGSVGEPAVSICNRGVWSAFSGASVCTYHPCDPSQRPSTQGWVCNNPIENGKLKDGTVCTLPCPAGTLGTAAFSTCKLGTWTSYQPPVCSDNACAASQRDSALGWVCNKPVANGKFANGTLCTMACPPNTVGASVSSACVSGAWTSYPPPSCTENSACKASQRLSANGWSCSAHAANGTYNEGTACILPCAGGKAMSSVCHKGEWTKYPLPVCSAGMACPVDPRMAEWKCNSTAVEGVMVDTTVCTSTCASGTNATSKCVSGNWTEAQTCPEVRACRAIHRQSINGWTCSTENVSGFHEEGTNCVLDCPGGTGVSSTCVAGEWTKFVIPMCSEKLACGASARNATRGWKCSPGVVGDLMVDGTECKLVCASSGAANSTAGDSNATSKCLNGVWTNPEITGCTEDLACNATERDARYLWTCSGTIVNGTYKAGTVCTQQCPAATTGPEVVSECVAGKWQTTNSTCKKLCPDGGNLCRSVEPGTSECGTWFAYNNSLVRYPENTTSSCLSLAILDSNVTSIGDQAFWGLSSLTSLDLTTAGIPRRPHRFVGLDNLLSLTVAGLGIDSLPHLAFEGLGKLTWLDLGANRISNITDDAFAELGSLQILNLAFNKLDSFANHTFEALGNLHQLILSNNNITTIDKFSFEGLTSLQHLDLKNNQIKAGPSSTGAFSMMPLEVLLLTNSGVTCDWAKNPNGGGAVETAFCTDK